MVLGELMYVCMCIPPAWDLKCAFQNKNTKQQQNLKNTTTYTNKYTSVCKTARYLGTPIIAIINARSSFSEGDYLLRCV